MLFAVDGRHCCSSLAVFVQLGMIQETAPDRDDSLYGTFRSAAGLMCVQHRCLLLDAFVSVECLERAVANSRAP